MIAKRENGSGSVYQRKSGQWEASITIGKETNGKIIRKTLRAKSETEAKRKLSQYLKTRKQTENLNNPLFISVSRYYEEIFLPYKRKNLKITSYRRLESTYYTYIKPALGDLQLGRIDTAIIQDLIDKQSKTMSYSTVKKIYDLLNACCKYNLAQPPIYRSLSYNPCTLVTIDRNKVDEQRTIKVFTEEEVGKIKRELFSIDENTGDLLYPYGEIYILMLNTGIRMGELLALTKDDFNLSDHTVRISKNAAMCRDPDDIGYQMIIQNTPKTKSSFRSIPLNLSAQNAVNDLFKRFEGTRYLALNKNGERINTNNVEKTFKKVLVRCGVDQDGRGCHALRHTFATTLFRKGVDVKIISQILGHSSTRITYDTYISVMRDQLAQAVGMIPDM